METEQNYTSLFAGRLKAIRELRGLTQFDLAEKAGFHPAKVSHFETGYAKPSLKNLSRLAVALDVSTDYLIGLTMDHLGKNGDAPKGWEKLSSRDRSTIEGLIKGMLST